MLLNIFAGIGVLAVLLLVGWIVWTYYKAGRLKKIGGVVTMIAMVASLPLGVRLAMERANLLTRASGESHVTASEYKRTEDGKVVVYVTLSDPAVAYIEVQDAFGNSELVVGEGRVEPRYAHSFVLNADKNFPLSTKIFVNGQEDRLGMLIN